MQLKIRESLTPEFTQQLLQQENRDTLYKTKKRERPMTDTENPLEGELILYQTPKGSVRVEVHYESETFWLNQKKIAELFGIDIRTVSYHLNEIYPSGELSKEATIQKKLESST